MMGSHGYIVVTGLIVVGGFVAVSGSSDRNVANHELIGVHLKEEARDAAMEGLNITIDRLMEDDGPWLDPNAYEVSGTPSRKTAYASSVTPVGAGDTVDVTSVGKLDFENVHGMRGEAKHTIEVRLIRLNNLGPIIAGWSER